MGKLKNKKNTATTTRGHCYVSVFPTDSNAGEVPLSLNWICWNRSKVAERVRV